MRAISVTTNVKMNYWNAVDYRTYRLDNMSTNYDLNVARKECFRTRQCELLISNEPFDLQDPTSVLGFLKTIKFSGESDNVHEVSVICMSPLFANNPVSNKLSSRIRASSDSKRNDDVLLSSFRAVVNYLLKNYATDDINAVANAPILRYIQ